MHVNAATLYLVATPIGNLKDITLRALEVLQAVQVIFCEDTRVTQRLLSAHGITAKLLPYHDQNGEAMRPKVLSQLAEGNTVALVSDAGSPLISDPGYKLCLAVRAAGFRVESIPGPSAVITALQLSGMPTDAFAFLGYVPRKQGEILALLHQYRPLGLTLVFYESPKRLLATLALLEQHAPDAEVVIARELTKRFEEICHGTPEALHADYAGRAEGVLGEIVLCLRLKQSVATDVQIDAALRAALQSHRVKEAAQMVAEQFGLSRKEVYARALTFKKDT